MADEVKLPDEVPRKTDDELRQFVNDYVSGLLFTSYQVQNPDTLGMVFMVLALGGLAGYPESYVKSIGLIYEYYNQAGPRAINGMPVFMSCRLLHKQDWDIAIASINAEIERRKTTPLIKPDATT